ncbi:3-oxoacyl-[acyl-carrier-protein] synthase-3 [Motilibacter rhizosphaerae]|uniref:3-oxoacyl-[acyl-carrier-protein] synthase-3 n=1 Tax=Motilibacter rhizosphaerae TaxID=598652 RepID=A0A4Q7NVI5_9ACTN|nr:3-oxoacyl-ACP synthase III [Motilibacter rhizosphaerae]RZS91276.1 3-oxoacyl-[acyl-carrier-protein] synthase-3 [Motilibacter rhizosphaerae]
MAGNASYTLRNTALLSVAGLEGPVVVTSAEIDERLAESMARLRLRPGTLATLTGIVERRWWPEEVSFADAAAMAGAKALSEAGVDPSQVGLLINSSVSREHLEPSTASAVHHLMGLPPTALNFDVTNACLGFVNAVQIAGTMIDSGAVQYAVVVDAEGARQTHEATIARLSRPETTREDFLREFATLTLGSGAAAAVLGRADEHPGAHRVLGGISRAGTEHHELCVGDLQQMRTDHKGLLEAGVQLARDVWAEAREAGWDWSAMDAYVMHQVSVVHTASIVDALGIDPDKVPTTYQRLGNVGPAALPITLADHAPELSPGDRVLCMGIGSGLNTSVLEIAW